ncbi:MAG: carbohydrate ABC transporter permease [Firmicutes bacterium]|nr:carbohydrate ABC transporter permease [Bacillota bacterium]
MSIPGGNQPLSDKIFDVCNYIFLSILLVMFLYPLVFIISASISNPDLVLRGEIWLLPKEITWEGYKLIMDYDDIWTGYRNSLLYVFVGVPFSMMLTFTAAYPLSRKDFRARNTIMYIYTFTMFFGGGLIPTYLLMRNLSLINNFASMIILPSAVSVYNIIVTRTYFQNNIPDELRNAAEIDGCNEILFFLRIVMPLSLPIIAVIGLFYAVGKWNLFFEALIYLTNRDLFPLQLVLREVVTSVRMNPEMLEGLDPSEVDKMTKITNSIKYGVIIVASVPVLLVYPFLQKYFVKGIMVGAIKG